MYVYMTTCPNHWKQIQPFSLYTSKHTWHTNLSKITKTISRRQYKYSDGGTHRSQVPARYFPINGAFAYSFLLDFPEFSRKCITNLGKTTICDLLSIRLSRICNYRFYIAKEQYPTSFIPLVAHQMNPDQPLSKGVQEVLLLLMQLTVKRTMFLIFSCMEKYQGNKYDS